MRRILYPTGFSRLLGPQLLNGERKSLSGFKDLDRATIPGREGGMRFYIKTTGVLVVPSRNLKAALVSFRLFSIKMSTAEAFAVLLKGLSRKKNMTAANVLWKIGTY